MDRTIYLQLSFNNEMANKTNLTIPYVRSDVTGEEVAALMDTIISSNVFTSLGGDLVNKMSAQLVDRNVNKYRLV